LLIGCDGRIDKVTVNGNPFVDVGRERIVGWQHVPIGQNTCERWAGTSGEREPDK
jgi:hypothetical protein